MFIHELEKLFSKKVSFDDDELLSHATDFWPRSLILKRCGIKPKLPQAVVQPTSIEEVQRLIQWANQNRVKLIPFGGGSGVCGAVGVVESAVSVDLRKLNRVLEINHRSQTVRAQAGILGPDLEKALNAQGFTLNHFPTSFHISTLGGWISTRASGQFSTKFGSIEDMTLGLKIVLPNGELLETKASPRSSTGPSLNGLFLGAEGSLGVIVEATCQIHRLAPSKKYASFSFRNLSSALDGIRNVVQSNILPSVVRLYDTTDTQVIASEMGQDISGNLLILVFLGPEELISTELTLANQILGQDGKTLGEAPAQHWWNHRFDLNDKRLTQILSSEGMILDTIEVAARWEHLEKLYDRMKEAMGSEVMVLAHFSHVYIAGASIYFTFIGNVGDQAALKTYDEIWAKSMEACLKNQGTISHHHGIGQVRKEWIKKELGIGLDLLRSIKKTMDPNQILNPGKWL